ncbi:hypothetical protein LINPERHAP2_LOCUS7712 [Linum perenne]
MHLVRRHRRSHPPRAPYALRRPEARSLRILRRRYRLRPPRQHRVLHLRRPEARRPPFRRAPEQQQIPQLPFLVRPSFRERDRRQKRRRV